MYIYIYVYTYIHICVYLYISMHTYASKVYLFTLYRHRRMKPDGHHPLRDTSYAGRGTPRLDATLCLPENAANHWHTEAATGCVAWNVTESLAPDPTGPHPDFQEKGPTGCEMDLYPELSWTRMAHAVGLKLCV